MLNVERWLPFDDAVSDRTRHATKIQRSGCIPEGKIPVIDQGQEEVAGYTNDVKAAYSGSLPVVLFGDHTRSLKFVDRPFAAGADGVKVLEPCADLESKFLWYYLRSRKLPNDGYSRHFKHLRSLRIPVPSKNDQHRVVELLSRAENVVRMRREAEAKTKEIIPALFLDMFGDPADSANVDRGGAATEVAHFGSLGTLERGKSRHRPRDAVHLYGGTMPFIQTGDVAQSRGVIDSFTQTYSDAGVSQSKVWPAGTLCITIAANIANAGILGFDACFPDSVVGFVPGPSVGTAYIQEWLAFLRPTLEAQAPQAAQKNINLEILRNLKVRVPSMDEQKKFARRVESIRLLQQSHKRARTHSDQAFQSLLAGVFGAGR